MHFVKRCGALVGALLLALALVVTIAPQGVSAHERRDIVGGKYQAVVGFLTEPAYQGQMNSLDLTVTSKTEKTPDGSAPKPIEGLEKTLKAQVISNGKTLDLTVQSRFNMPGKYAAYFQPTASGQYSFRVYGDINGDKVDEKFDSGPNTFGDVQPIAALQFPNAVAAAPADLQAQLDAAKSAADTARLIAIVGVVVGVLGLVVAGMALMRRPAANAGAGRITSQASEGDD
jgi:hypothetical protein